MTAQEFYAYFQRMYGSVPFSAQLRKQANTIAYLKLEMGKLRKQLNALTQKKKEN